MSKELIEYMKTHDVCEGDVKSLIEDYESQAREIESLKYDNELLRSLSFRDERDKLRAALVEAVDAFEIAVKLNSFREFNDHIPAMKVLLTRCKEVLSCS